MQIRTVVPAGLDAGGLPLAVRVTGGNRHDVTQVLPLVEQVPPIRGARAGRCGAPASCSAIAPTTPTHTATHCGLVGSDPGWPDAGCRTARGWGGRWVVERSFAWLHAFKRLNVRWEYRADIHQALLAPETFLEGRMTTNLLDRVGSAAFLAAAARV